ncbi:hypothetical protein UlMin_010236 [Ulmus minor]
MTSGTPGTTRQKFHKDTANAISGDRISALRNANNISIQTGEEFSPEFLHDRAAQRRLPPVVTDERRLLPKRVGFNLNAKQHEAAAYEDHTGVRGLRRMDSEHGSEVSDFGSSSGYVADVDYKVYPNNLSRYHWEYGATGQVSGKVADEMHCDCVNVGLTMPCYYAAESPQPYHSYVPGFSEGSFAGKAKFLCSFGGRILPRPSDGKLRYVSGDTRILSIRKNIIWEELVKKTSAIYNHPHTIKYQLPGEDLDSLISVCSNEDLHNMFEEYQELERNEGSQRLRIFLVSLNDSESPNSFEGRSTQQSDGDYQYVVAVNGMLEKSPRKSSSGQSLASQSSHLGNNSDYSPSFPKDSPTSAYENKDCSPSTSNMVGHLTRPAPQFSNSIFPSKSSNQLPSISLVSVQQRDPENSNLHYYLDQEHADDDDSIPPVVAGKLPCQDSYYVDAMGYYHGPTQMNYHQHNRYLVDSDHTNRHHEMSFHHRSRSGESAPSALNPQSGMKFGRPMHKEGQFNCERSISQPENAPGNVREGSHHKMIHVLSDSQLQEMEERSSERVLPLPTFKIKTDKSPLVTIPKEGLMQHENIIDRRPQVEQHDFQSVKTQDKYKGKQGNEVLNSTNENKYHDDHYKIRFEEKIELSSFDDAFELDNLPNISYLHNGHISSQDLQIPEGKVSTSPVTSLESSANTGKQNFQPSSKMNRISSQPFFYGSPGLAPVSSQEFDGIEFFVPSSEMDLTFDSDREVSIPDKHLLNHTDHEIKVKHTREFKERSKLQGAVSTHENKMKKLPVIIEDITYASPHVIPTSSKMVLYVEDEISSECASLREMEVESAILESDGEGEEGGDRDMDESMSDAIIAEIEAGIYGLQIIKNADLEELQELGSGTFGTVYHGKWRGTDVAIKRIKKSCFSGRSSEQERLIKDFWREAQILSTLHHPNVVAFYGVVPDGPGGTLATLTEFMVNGSLRLVLQKKDRVLDRRKKLMIAMDAAFGMEYLHLKNIVHFDLKCDNLLVNLRDPERPICKVGDFGLSRIKRNTFVSGGVRGTLPWMAPELLNGSSSRVSEKVDVFSFGIVMWEILTGEEPYADMHCGAIIGGIVNNMLRPAIPKRCDSEWKKLMEECWSAEPALRPSFTEITNRLRDMSMTLQKNKRQHPSSR